MPPESIIPEITACAPQDYERMLNVWVASVRSSHDFLTDAQIAALKPHVPEAFRKADRIDGIRNSAGEVIGFVGVTGDELDMLFVDPPAQGLGIGTALFDFARDVLGAKRVDVNEGNHAAIRFYERRGARRVGRSERDGLGNPYPLLHYDL